MAGDWIKMRTDLADDPAVIAIAIKTHLDECSVVGRLHKLWSWADRHCNAEGNAEGNAPGVTVAWVDRFVGADGFGKAMCDSGWLREVDSGVQFPRFDRHNSQTAKDRALTAKRVAQHKRTGNASTVTSTVTTCVTNALPREEKRREEDNTPLPPLDSAGFESAFAEFWNSYPLDRDGKRVEVESCRVQFSHIPPHQWQDVIKSAKHYAAGSEVAEGYVTKPAKFLVSKWPDWVEPPKVSRTPTGGAPANALASLAELEAMNARAREIAERRKQRSAGAK